MSDTASPSRSLASRKCTGGDSFIPRSIARRNIELLVLPVPNKESIYPEQLTARGQAISASDQDTIIIAPPTRTLLAELRAAEVAVVDLFALYRQAKLSRTADHASKLYLQQDTHWSPVGVDLAAHAVAEILTEHRWIEQGTARYGQRTTSVIHKGDLLQMLAAPSIAHQFGSEIIECTQVFSSDDEQPYHSVPEAEILVLGDSFLRVYEQDPPGSAGFLAQLAAELRQPLAAIVNDGGASTLVRQQLARNPDWLARKKVVIWEFVERDIIDGVEGWQEIALPR